MIRILKIIRKHFFLPVVVFLGLLLYLFLNLIGLHILSLLVVFITILLGSYDLFIESYENIKVKQFGLDYIAILAVVISIISQEYLVGAIIAFMLATGRTLEKYGSSRAEESLTALSDRIPQTVLLINNDISQHVNISDVHIGDIISIRKGEVISLDGELISETAVIDESSLTGEPYPEDKVKGSILRSGTINSGNPIKLKVTKEEKDSSYHKIVQLVTNARREKPPLVRLANRYSVWFTIITFIIAGFAFLLHNSLYSILAVLVVATPCPLILATPIALMGGMNKFAKRRIIIKNLASIEVLSRVNSIIFDKTGTITLGRPEVTEFILHDKTENLLALLGAAEAIERNSLHPLAKAIMRYAKEKNAPVFIAQDIHEEVGRGIKGTVKGVEYLLKKVSTDDRMAIGLYKKQKLLGSFILQDTIKMDSKSSLEALQHQGVEIAMYTGDKKETAEQLIKSLKIPISLKAECTPEDKMKGIHERKKMGKTIAMVGDGINDAPALAAADVGMVFSNEEQTAASEAADVVFLGGNFSQVITSLYDSRYTIKIATQSIVAGIGMSLVCMILASFGWISPFYGAIIQELIDVVVIINALRTSR